MRISINASQKGTQNLDTDALMGGLGKPIDTAGIKKSGCTLAVPYCQQEAYMDTIYCACQNIGVPHAACIFAPCESNPLAYKNTSQQASMVNPQKNCPDEIVCNNIESVGGNNNIVEGYQNSNCGSTIQNFISNAKKHPFVAVFVVILVILLAMALLGPSRSPSNKKGKTPLPSMDDQLGLGSLPSLD